MTAHSRAARNPPVFSDSEPLKRLAPRQNPVPWQPRMTQQQIAENGAGVLACGTGDSTRRSGGFARPFDRLMKVLRRIRIALMRRAAPVPWLDPRRLGAQQAGSYLG